MQFGGDFVDDNYLEDENGKKRILNETAGFDAICFKDSTVLTQWKKKNIDRELKKAFDLFSLFQK